MQQYPFSPDLALLDFFFFPKLKIHLKVKIWGFKLDTNAYFQSQNKVLQLTEISMLNAKRIFLFFFKNINVLFTVYFYFGKIQLPSEYFL